MKIELLRERGEHDVAVTAIEQHIIAEFYGDAGQALVSMIFGADAGNGSIADVSELPSELPVQESSTEG